MFCYFERKKLDKVQQKQVETPKYDNLLIFFLNQQQQKDNIELFTKFYLHDSIHKFLKQLTTSLNCKPQVWKVRNNTISEKQRFNSDKFLPVLQMRGGVKYFNPQTTSL
jgi:hypothetical protein